MSGNYKSGFKRYKRNLRWKSTMRHQAAHGLIPCPDCGGDIQYLNYSCPTCGGMGQRLDNIGLSGQPQHEHEPCPTCHGSGRDGGVYACQGCRRQWRDDDRALQEVMPGGIDCPKCGSQMYEQHNSPLFKDGAWECSNQDCWHMMPLNAVAPDAPPPGHPDDWS